MMRRGFCSLCSTGRLWRLKRNSGRFWQCPGFHTCIFLVGKTQGGPVLSQMKTKCLRLKTSEQKDDQCFINLEKEAEKRLEKETILFLIFIYGVCQLLLIRLSYIGEHKKIQGVCGVGIYILSSFLRSAPFGGYSKSGNHMGYSDEKISKLLCNSFCRYTTKKFSRIVGTLGIMLERKIFLCVFRWSYFF